MRIVVDTNVIVSAALKDISWPGSTLRWISKYGGLLKSTDTEREVLQVLQRPYFSSKIDPLFLENISRIFALAELIDISERISACRDAQDDKFLELAVNGKADIIISGDNDLLDLDTFRDIPIITPAAFGHARAM